MTSGKRLDFGSDPERDTETGNLKGILPLRDRGSCKNLAGSGALAEFCGLRSPSAIFCKSSSN